jgi:hypothetical protein
LGEVVGSTRFPTVAGIRHPVPFKRVIAHPSYLWSFSWKQAMDFFKHGLRRPLAATKQDVRHSTFDQKPAAMNGKRVHLVHCVHHVHSVHTTLPRAGQKTYADWLDV